jgi:redox-sensitive bicupin YhaK (pirin superfamily)
MQEKKSTLSLYTQRAVGGNGTKGLAKGNKSLESKGIGARPGAADATPNVPLDNSRDNEYYPSRATGFRLCPEASAAHPSGCDRFPEEDIMITIRKSKERGHADLGWLNTRFTFSFADYYDPKHIQFRTLRVMNDDRVAGGGGFPMHPHRDMEIVTYVLDGALEHRDSMGNGSVIRPGDIQYMSAGTGVTHSEFNASKTEPVHLYQIWMFPENQGLKPAYDQKNFTEAEKRGKLRLLASPDGRDGAVRIRQNNELYATVLGTGESVKHELKPERHAYVQVARGSIKLNGKELSEGDGAAISAEKSVELTGVNEAEVLLFDLA